jgi:nucleoside-diphosphate-sugar epimerase
LVFHCASGNTGNAESQQRVNAIGTKNILDAAVKADVPRLVHMSTVLVYGPTDDGDLNETGHRRNFGDAYGSSKLVAEQLALEFDRRTDLSVSVLQPTAVYGPYGPTWTVAVLESMKAGRRILVNDGSGLCNAVYVDDVVNAMLLAATNPAAGGEAFLVSGEEPVTWREFFKYYEDMLGEQNTVSMSEADANSYYASFYKRRSLLTELSAALRQDPSLRERVRGSREVAALLRFVPRGLTEPLRARVRNGVRRPEGLGDARPILPLHPRMVRFFAAKTRVRIEKARAILGYAPMVDLATGMQLTELWARWANLLG